MGFNGPSILCCRYTQFDVLKIFLEHIEAYALLMRYAWKMDFLKKNIEFCQAQPNLQLSWAELALFPLLDPTEPTRPEPTRNSFPT